MRDSIPLRSRCLSRTNVSVSSGTRRIVLAVSTLGMLGLAAPAAATTDTFNYTGAAQSWTVPAGVTEATFDLYGAQGDGGCGQRLRPGPRRPGDGDDRGHRRQLDPGEHRRSGRLRPQQGGFNGGGDGAVDNFGQVGGGGASDIRIGGTTLENRVLVAGGGGGGGGVCCADASAVGGDGGGLSVCPGVHGVSGRRGRRWRHADRGRQRQASRAMEGVFGLGGNGGVPTNATTKGGGGGGGWYGGGGGDAGGGGGGGSGYGPPGTSLQTGVQSGNGLVTITYTCRRSPT